MGPNAPRKRRLLSASKDLDPALPKLGRDLPKADSRTHINEYNVYSNIYDNNSSTDAYIDGEAKSEGGKNARKREKMHPLDGARAQDGTAQRKDTVARACAVRLNASGEHMRTANAHHASRERKSRSVRDGALACGYVGVRHTRHAGAMGRITHTPTRARTCSCGARRPGTKLPMPGGRSEQGEGRSQADTPSGGRASCTTPLWRVRTYGGGASARTSIVHRASHAATRSSPHVRCGQAGMRAHADNDASCEVLYGGADADAGAEAGSLALRLAGGGEQMPRRERPTDARRTPPQLVEKPKDEMTQGPGPRQPARVRSGARHRRVKQRMLYTRIRRVTHLHVFARLGSCSRSPLPFIHPSSPTPTTPPRRSPTLASSPSIAPPAPASVRRSARGSWGVGARPSWVWVRPSELRSWVWVRSGSFLPTPLLLRAGLLLETDGALSGGGGVGLDADAKEVLEANSGTEVGPSKDAGCARADDVDVRRRGRRGASPCGKGPTMVGIGAASARVDAAAAAGAEVRDIDARRSGRVMGGPGARRGGARRARRSVGVDEELEKTARAARCSERRGRRRVGW
ncbi:hypothetical protein B0H14DRAFT_3139882 [Mycena olivaceomarginata]|nr:hypothetical protein B0H14DRAFT_3139882 [Mycena olivaceomarginata]